MQALYRMWQRLGVWIIPLTWTLSTKAATGRIIVLFVRSSSTTNIACPSFSRLLRPPTILFRHPHSTGTPSVMCGAHLSCASVVSQLEVPMFKRVGRCISGMHFHVRGLGRSKLCIFVCVSCVCLPCMLPPNRCASPSAPPLCAVQLCPSRALSTGG